MRIFQIRTIPLSQLPPQPLLLLPGHPTRLGASLSPLILPHIIPSPRTNQHKFHSQTNTSANRARNITRRIRRFENLTAAHISHAVAHERRGGDDGFFGPSGHVGGDECPGEKEGEYEGDCEDVEAPFGPLVLGCVG